MRIFLFSCCFLHRNTYTLFIACLTVVIAAHAYICYQTINYVTEGDEDDDDDGGEEEKRKVKIVIESRRKRLMDLRDLFVIAADTRARYRKRMGWRVNDCSSSFSRRLRTEKRKPRRVARSSVPIDEKFRRKCPV